MKARVKRTIQAGKKVYAAPLYSSEKRSEFTFIDYVPLPINSTENEWILRGTALICSDMS